jgi:hypothetical protein
MRMRMLKALWLFRRNVLMGQEKTLKENIVAIKVKYIRQVAL